VVRAKLWLDEGSRLLTGWVGEMEAGRGGGAGVTCGSRLIGATRARRTGDSLHIAEHHFRRRQAAGKVGSKGP